MIPFLTFGDFVCKKEIQFWVRRSNQWKKLFSIVYIDNWFSFSYICLKSSVSNVLLLTFMAVRRKAPELQRCIERVKNCAPQPRIFERKVEATCGSQANIWYPLELAVLIYMYYLHVAFTLKRFDHPSPPTMGGQNLASRWTIHVVISNIQQGDDW